MPIASADSIVPWSGNESLQRLRQHFSHLPPPIVVFNKSHSGSRVLATLLEAHGIHMGSHLNVSHDSISLLPLVEHFVNTYYPNYAPLWTRERWPGPSEELVIKCFAEHLACYDGHCRWGWKLCETTFIIPVIAAIFPAARMIHLLRDGRDVAFCDHVAPVRPFWRKVYFNNDRISQWRGLSLTNREYDCRSHIYNSLHWLNSVEVGRAYGQMLQERYVEVRYEDLCTDFGNTSRRVLAFCGVAERDDALQQCASTIHVESVGKFKSRSRRKQRDVMRLIEPTLLSLGYVHVARRRGFRIRAKETWYALLRPIIRLIKRRHWAKSGA